jgi:hypothetical protein
LRRELYGEFPIQHTCHAGEDHLSHGLSHFGLDNLGSGQWDAGAHPNRQPTETDPRAYDHRDDEAGGVDAENCRVSRGGQRGQARGHDLDPVDAPPRPVAAESIEQI